MLLLPRSISAPISCHLVRPVPLKPISVMSCGAIPAMFVWSSPDSLSTFPSRSLDLWGPPEITLVIAHLSVWVSVGLSRRLIASEVENEEGIDRTRWLLHVHIEFLVASNTSEQHEPLHYSVQFRAFIVVCTVPLMCVGLLRRRIIDRKWA